MTGIAAQLEELRDTIGEIDALAALALDAFDRSDWRGANHLLVERTAYVLGMVARSAAIAPAGPIISALTRAASCAGDR